jgi:hypothetical protein
MEAGVWLIYAMVLAVGAVRSAKQRRAILLIASIGFVTFGVSDLIEAQTGAWWRPWWLLVLRAACIATFLACWLVWRRQRK